MNPSELFIKRPVILDHFPVEHEERPKAEVHLGVQCVFPLAVPYLDETLRLVTRKPPLDDHDVRKSNDGIPAAYELDALDDRVGVATVINVPEGYDAA